MTDSTQSARAIEIFFSYAHEDEGLRDELEKHLSILKRQGVISGWHDRRIGAGREWEREIDAHLNTAQVILLLISPDFIASEYCWDVEVKRAMKRHEVGEARVIPVILRPVVWEGAPFGKLKALPTDAKPVTKWANQDEAFEDIARGIQVAISKLKEGTLEFPDRGSVWDDSEIPKGRIDYQLDYEKAREELQSIPDEFRRRQAEWQSEWEKCVADVNATRRYSGPGSADRQKKAVQALGEHLSDFAFDMLEMNTRLDEISPNLQTSARKLWEGCRDKNDREAAQKHRDSLEQLPVIPSPELNKLTELADQLEKVSRESRDLHKASRRMGDQLRTYVKTWELMGRFSESLMAEIQLWLND